MTDRKVQEEFYTWLQQDEQLNGCRRLSGLEKDQMFISYQAAYSNRQEEITRLKTAILWYLYSCDQARVSPNFLMKHFQRALLAGDSGIQSFPRGDLT